MGPPRIESLQDGDFGDASLQYSLLPARTRRILGGLNKVENLIQVSNFS
jgi:hypothetical protein